MRCITIATSFRICTFGPILTAKLPFVTIRRPSLRTRSHHCVASRRKALVVAPRWTKRRAGDEAVAVHVPRHLWQSSNNSSNSIWPYVPPGLLLEVSLAQAILLPLWRVRDSIQDVCRAHDTNNASSGGLWASSEAYLMKLLDHLEHCGAHRDADVVRSCLFAATQQEGTAPLVITRLMYWLLDLSATQSAAGDTNFLARFMKPVLLNALPHHVSGLVQSLSLPPPPPQPASSLGLRTWHPLVTDLLCKACLRHVSTIISNLRTAMDLPSDVLHALHRCVLCQFPSVATDRAMRVEMGSLTFACLKWSSYCSLRLWYEYLENVFGADAVAVALQKKFIAACSSLLTHSSQTNFGCRDGGVIIERVVRLLLAEKQKQQDEIGQYNADALSKGVGLLAVLDRAGPIYTVHSEHPELRWAPHTILMYARLGKTTTAIDALLALAQSRPEGWVRLPDIILLTIYAVCRYVGHMGSGADDVTSLYRAVVAFHNTELIVSQCMEYVLAGICDRIRGLLGHFGNGPPAPTTRAVVDHVVPITRTTLDHCSDDINTDSILDMLHAAVCAPYDAAVPLCTALIRVVGQTTSHSVAALLSRAHGPSNGMPLLHYYTLCCARDGGYVDVLDHLSAIWQFINMRASATPHYQLWRCAACGRANSDRFNYCLCGALRNGYILCSTCGYMQDERWPQCQSCGQGTRGKVSCAFARRRWTCKSCGGSNSALKTLLCSRCAQPTGPVAWLSPAEATSGGDAHARRERPSFCCCPPSEDNECSSSGTGTSTTCGRYEELVGYCRRCCGFLSSYAAVNSLVWRCEGCHQLRSSLERLCPACPHVEFVAAAVVHRVTDVRHCQHCHAVVENPFRSTCPQCASAELLLSKHEQSAHDIVPAAVPILSGGEQQPATRLFYCVQCWMVDLPDSSETKSTSAHCRHCDSPPATLHRTATVQLTRTCCSCTAAIQPTCTSAVCPHCAAFIGSQEWSPLCIRQTCAALSNLYATSLGHHHDGGGDATPADPFAELLAYTKRLGALIAAVEALMEEWFTTTPLNTRVPISAFQLARVDAVMDFSRIVSTLTVLYPFEPLARRAAALLKQLMSFMDVKCGHSNDDYFLVDETCHECLGGHPSSLCSYNAAKWTCEECGAESFNDDVRRYVCSHCLALRPEVQLLLVSDCWHCAHCHRANLNGCETYCIHCNRAKPKEANAEPDFASSCLSELTAAAATTFDANCIPFCPMKCTTCGLMHLEACCPLCTHQVPHTAVETVGVVHSVGKQYAFIQPAGTELPQDRVYVGEHLMRRVTLSEGLTVHYAAELGNRGGLVMQATHLKLR